MEKLRETKTKFITKIDDGHRKIYFKCKSRAESKQKYIYMYHTTILMSGV